MKKQIRLLGIDDAPFTFTDTHTTVIGVVMRGGEYLECVLKNTVHIDGTDATTICQHMITHTKHYKQLKAVLLDGITFGGFNVINIKELHENINIPIITITRDKPNLIKIKQALKKYFPDWKYRYHLITQGKMHRIPTSTNPT